MHDLTISIIQTNLEWENPDRNLDTLSQHIDAIQEKTDLIILPEMFSTGFTMNAPKLAEKSDGRTVEWMKSKASAKNAEVIGSVIIEEDSKFYNRLFWVKNDGRVLKYDKRHLFRMANEHKIYSAGSEKVISDIKGWNVLPLVCYDLRFPVWSRSENQNYDLLIYIANWPERRSAHWRLLLQARAVENQAFVAGVNRVGKDGLDIHYRGDSAIVDPLGNIIKQEAENEFIHTETLSAERLLSYRKKFPVWMDADNFKIVDES